MKPKFNASWLWIAVVIIGNIGIFYFMSKKLENYVADSMKDHITVNGYNYGEKSINNYTKN